MSRHLTDRRLLDALTGEDDADREHLASCATCTARSVQVAHDLATLRGVLRDGPPPVPVAPLLPARHWLLVTAAAATVLLLVWSTRPPRPKVHAVRVVSLERLSSAVFSAAEVYALTPPTSGDPMAAVQAALRGEWPCARRDTCSE